MTELISILIWPLAVVLIAAFIVHAAKDVVDTYLADRNDVEFAALHCDEVIQREPLPAVKHSFIPSHRDEYDVDLSTLQGTPGTDQLKVHWIGPKHEVVTPSDTVQGGQCCYLETRVSSGAALPQRVPGRVEVDGSTPAVVAQPSRVPSLAERTALYEALMESAILAHEARHPATRAFFEIAANTRLLACSEPQREWLYRLAVEPDVLRHTR